MPYRVELDQDTGLVDRLMGLPIEVQRTIHLALQRLAENPTKLSVPAALPSPPGFQVYRFEHVDADGRSTPFAAYFQYGADEQTLWVYEVRKEPPT